MYYENKTKHKNHTQQSMEDKNDRIAPTHPPPQGKHHVGGDVEVIS